MNHLDKNNSIVSSRAVPYSTDLVVNVCALFIFCGLMYKGISSLFDSDAGRMFHSPEKKVHSSGPRA